MLEPLKIQAPKGKKLYTTPHWPYLTIRMIDEASLEVKKITITSKDNKKLKNFLNKQ